MDIKTVPKEGRGSDVKILPSKVVAIHRVRWNMSKESERWLCYGGAPGIVLCEEIVSPEDDEKLLKKGPKSHPNRSSHPPAAEPSLTSADGPAMSIDPTSTPSSPKRGRGEPRTRNGYRHVSGTM
ncbi:hypothetical protein Ancab_031662 [Ancistrocladus abbreviatus]